jgi:peptide subunit release factor 1 (eRF1)
MELLDLKEELFAKQLNTKFYIQFEDARIELELVEVAGDSGSLDKIEGVERFAIYFLGPSEGYLEQRTYMLEHDALGQLEIFLVPVGRQDDRYKYEAVFSHFESKAEGGSDEG